MNSRKRIVALLLVVVMMVGTISAFSVTTSGISDADFVAPKISVPDYIQMPANDLLTNNQTFTLGEGTRYEIDLKTQFIPYGQHNRPSTCSDTIYSQKYVVVHNTGAYPRTSTALANHNYGRGGTAEVSWHYTCGNDGLYQMLPVNEKGWHAGGNYWNSSNIADKTDGTNSNSIGIETATPGFPADDTFSGEHWNQADMYDWYATTFDDTATYLAMLVAFICVNLNFNPYTQTITHYHTSAKNCPIQMRYVFGTNASFSVNGTYYKVYRDRMYDFYKAFGGSYISSDTFQNTYYNPNYSVYKTGLYKASSAVTVYRGGNTSTGSVGTVAAGSVVDVDIVGWNWGKITLSNGTKGWVNLNNLSFVRNDYDYGTYRTSGGQIVNVTSISGSTATYEGGTANISTLTRVYGVTVKNDTTFGSETKYFAKGETFTVTADTSVGNFDIWEVRSGIATITDKTATTTTVKVVNSDIVLHATFRDEFKLTIENGSGGGHYKAGTTVDISASAMKGQKFTYWEITSGSGEIGNPNSYNTTFTLGASNATVRANFETAGAFDPGYLTNYALGKSYSVTMNGDSATYYSGYSNQQETGNKLTDGNVATDSYSTTDTPYVAFQGSSKTLAVTINLGTTRNVGMVAIRDVGDSGASVGDFTVGSAVVEYSTDGSNYSTASNIKDTMLYSYAGGSELSNVYTHQLDFTWVKAKYVRVSFLTATYITAFTEIGVYGDETMVEPVPDVLELTTDAASEGYKMDEEYVTGAAVGLNVAALKKLFKVSVSVKNPSGTAVESGNIGTGYKVTFGVTTVEVVVTNDVDGDAICSATDLLIVNNYILSGSGMTTIALKAGDSDANGIVSSTDYMIMEKVISG